VRVYGSGTAPDTPQGSPAAVLRKVPWWLRAYLLLGTAQGLAIGLTGFFTPADVIGFPLQTTPLNTRFVASFYLAGAVGLGLSAIARHAVDARIFVAGFAVVTSLLLLATLMYWSDFRSDGVPYPWLVSYLVDPVIGAAALWQLGLARPALRGRHRLSAIFAAVLVVFGILGVVLLVAPGTAVAHWPWKLTEILARVYAAIFLAFALGAALAAFERRREAVRPFTLSALTLVGLITLASLIHRDRFVAGAAPWIWGVGLAAGIALLALASACVLRPRAAL
jgi:hypothetical protein